MLPSGDIRYQVRVRAAGPDGASRQLRRRFETSKAAGEFLDALQDKLQQEAAQAAADEAGVVTVAEAVERWLAAQRINPTTLAAYTAALAPLVDRFDSRDVRTISDDEVEQLVQDLVAGTGPGGRKWKRTSINPMLARTKAVWKDLERRKILSENPIQYLKPLRKKDDADAYEGALDLSDRLSEGEVARLVTMHSAVDLPLLGGPRSARYMAVVHAPMVHLALIGLRRGELAGLRWSAIDLDAGRITVAVRTRVRVTGRTIDQKNGKTTRARRSLKLPASVLTVLRGTQERQQIARKRAGEAWVGARDLHVLAHWDGRAVAPRTLDDWWKEALRYAQVPHRRLHAARHTAASRLIAAGATPSAVAAWLGHADGGTLVLRTYAHTDVSEVDALAALLG
ncbi:Site-specific recombinase XerD [Rhodococcus tukisamuensis]|uniref:Site-specific recombinase XerD n=1 Tax=Rhodococcus tukisamuensis TaxID=168276 RepID=A0A1G6MJ52_9NOCA|nr:Site-specific recombinase XerD [Rhodococcus tukisamuensis]